MAAGRFIRHKLSGFETYLPEDQWDESMAEEWNVRSPDDELKAAFEQMKVDSDRHDEAVRRLDERATRKAEGRKPKDEPSGDQDKADA